jgi:hypothetical protein
MPPDGDVLAALFERLSLERFDARVRQILRRQQHRVFGFQKLRDASFQLQTPAVEHRDAVADVFDIGQQMRRKQHRFLLPFQIEDQILDLT